jgi:hypothetical protein
MDIKVKIIKENKDGSANAQVDFDKEGLETLIQWGLVAMLTKAVDEYAIRPDETKVSLEPPFPIKKQPTKNKIKKVKK